MSYADPDYLKKIGVDPEKLISFAGGWVNHESPEDLRNAYSEIINQKNLFHKSGGYSPTNGMKECKNAIVSFEKEIYGVDDLTENNIIVGANSTQLMFNLFGTLLNPGDKVLLLDPTYCNFPIQIIAATNAEILRFKIINETDWKYNDEEYLDELTEFILKNKPKMFILSVPDNPTSSVHSEVFINSVLSIMQKIDGYLVIDFAYKEISFLEKSPNYFRWGAKKNLITVHSNSKWNRGLGRRLGWIEAEEKIIEMLMPMQSSTILCPDTLHQMAFTNHINSSIENGNLKKILEKNRREYKSAAELVVMCVEKYLGFRCLTPQGGLYTCIDVGMDGDMFVDEILKNTGVLFVPGRGFGESLKNAIRVSFGPLVGKPHLIEEGFRRVGDYLKNKK